KVAEELKKKQQPNLLRGFVMGSCFFEPSTRTRLSFETAMQRLGGTVVGFADPAVTSVKKGETLSDTAQIVSQYADVIVMRHALEGAPRYASEVIKKPVINAGDGGNQHPTQGLLDLFTIKECQKKIDGLHIAIIGDLKYGRGIHSLVQTLKHFNVRLYLVAPTEVQLPEAFRSELKQAGIKFSLHDTFEQLIPNLDIIYLIRMQEERFLDRLEYERLKHTFFLKLSMLEKAKPSMRILHIMPRVCEMDTAIDATPHAYYFQEAQNGLYVRQALLALVLGKI
ncbi:MAG: aspartate carbamoyltransferase, partial [Patescibacteria group bacterium]